MLMFISSTKLDATKIEKSLVYVSKLCVCVTV